MKQIWVGAKKIGLIESFLLALFIINPLGRGIYIGYLLSALILLKPGFIKRVFDFDTMLIFLFGLTYGLFFTLNPVSGVQYIVFYLAYPFIFFIWGKYLVQRLSENEIFYALLFIGVLFSFNALISVLLNIMQSGFQAARDVPMFWTSVAKNPTGTSAFFVYNICFAAIVIAKRDLKFLYKGILLSLFVLSFICVLRLGSRTQLALAFIHVAITILYIIPKQSFKRTLGIFVSFFLVAFLIYQNVSFDLDANWLAAFETRLRSGGENTATAGNRTELWSNAINNMMESPFGWDKSKSGFAHNTWLEIARIGGIIPFIIFIIFSIRMLLVLKDVIFRKLTSIGTSVCLVTYFLGIYIVLMVEPIIVGSLQFFLTYCLISGMVKEISYRAKPFTIAD